MLGSASTTLDVSITNSTIENLTNTSLTSGVQGVNLIVGPFAGFLGGDINASIQNVTITNLNAPDGSASGIAGVSMTGSGDATIDIDVRNSTITGMNGTIMATYPLPSAALNAAGYAATNSESANVTFTTTNLVLANNLNDGAPSNCSQGSINSAFGGSGPVNTNLTSAGGNLSDDSSCEPYFTDPTDQNNVSGLAASLSPLADNGGYVPTMALLSTSPAVDSGVTVAGLTTDARGATRPQGTAYDSGAYESPYTRPATDTTDTESLAESGEYIVGLIGFAVLLLVVTAVAMRGKKTILRA